LSTDFADRLLAWYDQHGRKDLPWQQLRHRYDQHGRKDLPWQQLRHSFSHYDLDIQPVVVRVDTSSRKVAMATTQRGIGSTNRRQAESRRPL